MTDKNVSEMTPGALAQACSSSMHAEDYCAQMMGVDIIESRPGFAELHMTVRKDMSNGHGICHGGMIFTLADTAFAHSCNNTNKVTVASGCNIEFISAGRLGDTLIARSEKRTRGNRTGVYDVTITNQNEELIALFRGKSYQLRGTLLPIDGEN